MPRPVTKQGFTLLAAVVLAAVALLVGGMVVWRAIVPVEDGHGAPTVPDVLSATELGPLRQHPRVNGRDAGQSARYGKQSIWVFGDTVLRQPWRFLSSTGAATTDLRAADGITVTTSDVFGATGAAPVDLLPFTPAEKAFTAAHAKETGCTTATDRYCGAQIGLWPGAMVADPARHRVLVLYHKLCRIPDVPRTPCSGPLGLGLGTGIAAIDLTTHRVTRLRMSGAAPLRSVEGVDPTLFFPHASGYTAATVLVDDDLYVYGDCDSRCHLARVPIGAVTDRSRWRYFSGRGAGGAAEWTADQERSTTNISAGSAGNTVLWIPALKIWLNVYMPMLTNTLTAQAGASPAGPWSRAFPLLTTDNGGSGANYAGFGHPEYAERNGLVQYVTYYQQSTYQIRLAKVVFDK